MKITVIGTYLHVNPIYIGGTEVRQGVTKEIQVSEDEFIRLIGGVQSGWFDLKAHNYAKFLEAERKPIHYNVDVAFLAKIGLPVFENAALEIPQKEEAKVEPVVEKVVEKVVVETVAPVVEENVIETVVEEAVPAVEEVAVEETEKPKRGRKSKTAETTEE